MAYHESREGITLDGNILLDDRYIHYRCALLFFSVNVQPMLIVTRLILVVPGFGPDKYIPLVSAFIVRYTH